jgi:hypothetical protein
VASLAGASAGVRSGSSPWPASLERSSPFQPFDPVVVGNCPLAIVVQKRNDITTRRAQPGPSQLTHRGARRGGDESRVWIGRREVGYGARRVGTSDDELSTLAKALRDQRGEVCAKPTASAARRDDDGERRTSGARYCRILSGNYARLFQGCHVRSDVVARNQRHHVRREPCQYRLSFSLMGLG